MEKKKVEKKTTKKEVKKPTTKKVSKTNTKKKKGFTLIELLAVIIILGILMIIAIPSVTSYINSSRKSAYVDTAKEIVAGTRNLVNEGKLGMYGTDTTYYIPAKYVNTENALKSPYGEFADKSAYIGVVYDGQGYKYYWISVDETGQGVDEIIPIDKFDEDDIKSDLDPNNIYNIVKTTGISDRPYIKVLNEDGTWGGPYQAERAPGDQNGENNNSRTAAQQIGEVEELVERADSKRYIGPSPNNYISFNGQVWRIIGVYGDNLKIISSSALTNQKYYEQANGTNAWDTSLAQITLNGSYYDSLTSSAKDMIDNHSWYSGSAWYNDNAASAYSGAKSNSWTGKVGLIATYEFLYTPNDETCFTLSGYSYDNSKACGKAEKNWLAHSDNAWTINKTSNNNYRANVLYSGGYVYDSEVNNTASLYPVVYLKSTVKITGGTGTSSDPYTLGL